METIRISHECGSVNVLVALECVLSHGMFQVLPRKFRSSEPGAVQHPQSADFSDCLQRKPNRCPRFLQRIFPAERPGRLLFALAMSGEVPIEARGLVRGREGGLRIQTAFRLAWCHRSPGPIDR